MKALWFISIMISLHASASQIDLAAYSHSDWDSLKGLIKG
jgi:hypothetical protein